MAFAKEYREEITFAYYCFNFVLTIVIFVVGTIYLKHRDRRDEQRKEDRDLRYQQIKEWRDFAETIRKEHNELKSKHIPWKISKVKNAFGKIKIYRDINGSDVLRFMMRDPDYERRCKNEHLDGLRLLREDLDSVYSLLNRCASLILLGKVPENITAELGKLVTDLVELTLPFYKGEERKTILKCLVHFGYCGREEDGEETQRSINVDGRLETDIPYVRRLKFQCSQYTDCSKFTCRFPLEIQGYQPKLRSFLEELHRDLEQERYMPGFLNELRERASNLNFIDRIDAGDPDELVVGKVLHEIRYYIHSIKQGPLNEDRIGNVQTLREIYNSITKIRACELTFRENCKRFVQDLSLVMESMEEFHKSEILSLRFQQLYEQLHKIAKRENGGPGATASNATVPNHGHHETYV